MEEDRIINPELENAGEERLENSLRPKTLEEYIGQDKVKENMKIYIEAAKKRGEPLDHCLFYGPPGLGKTTLSNIISNEMNSNIKITSGPAIEKPGDLAAILTNLSEFDVLFIDEIHRLSKSVEEILYPALEDYTLDIIIGKGPSARSIRLDLPKFTLIGATTKAGSLTTPLRDRFGIVHRLELYDVEDLTKIIKRSSKILEVEIEDAAAKEIARRSRGTPRIANRLLKRVRDYAAVLGDGNITLKITKHALNKLEIDELGLDDIDRKLLDVMITQYAGRPVGIEALAATIGEEIDTIEDVYEPYLIQIGFIARTLRGRQVLPPAYKHLGYEIRKGESMKLLLHTCCAPCSVYCIDTLRNEGIEPTIYWFNPNIHPYMEYKARRDCLKEYTKSIDVEAIFEENYGLDEFCKNVVNSLETRCQDYCYPVRLEQTAKYAKEHGYTHISTTLLISPYQKHDIIKDLGNIIAEKYGLEFLYRDFRVGFREGQAKAREIGLYMQKYCGCIFSEEDRYQNKIEKDKKTMNICK